MNTSTRTKHTHTVYVHNNEILLPVLYQPGFQTVHETEGLRIVGARVLSESGKVESSVEFPMITSSTTTPSSVSSTHSSSQSMAHTLTPDTQEVGAGLLWSDLPSSSSLLLLDPNFSLSLFT